VAVDLTGVSQPLAPSHKVWLIGGTSESADLAQALWSENIPFVVTVTTAAAKSLYSPTSQVRVGALTPEAMATFVIEHDICCILDASHPFATEISRQAIALSNPEPSQPDPPQSKATTKSIPYLRYERVRVGESATTPHHASRLSALHHEATLPATQRVTTVASIESLVASDLLHHQRVLLTLGYRHLARFAPLRAKATTLFARVLPSPEAIAGAIAAGFSAQEIMALRPPVSLALEKALWQQWKISCVVAKASGQPSGEAVKRQVAEQLGIPLILIARPPMAYPKQTHLTKEAIAFCTQTLKMYYPNA